MYILSVFYVILLIQKKRVIARKWNRDLQNHYEEHVCCTHAWQIRHWCGVIKIHCSSDLVENKFWNEKKKKRIKNFQELQIATTYKYKKRFMFLMYILFPISLPT